MSKLTLRKTLADFDAPALRQLIIDLYDKSKEAKEILDFFADPDITAKTEQYRLLLTREALRTTRRGPHPRMQRIRATLRRIRALQPGDETIAELMVSTLTALISNGDTRKLPDTLYASIEKFLLETLDHLTATRLLPEHLPRLLRARSQLRPLRSTRSNPLADLLDARLSPYIDPAAT